VSAGLLESPFGVRWTTLITAVAIVAVMGIWRRRPFVACVVILAWLGGFEVAFRLLDILRWHEWSAWAGWLWEAAALIGWLLAAHAFGIRPSRLWVAVTALVFVVWWLSGYDYNLPNTAAGQGLPIRWAGEVENVTAKTAWAMAYIAGTIPGIREVALREFGRQPH
jgi:hypothetical protein